MRQTHNRARCKIVSPVRVLGNLIIADHSSKTSKIKNLIFWTSGCNEDEKFPYPIIEDKERKLANQLGMVDKDELDAAGMPLTARAVFIVDANKKFRLSILYPATTGRNFE